MTPKQMLVNSQASLDQARADERRLAALPWWRWLARRRLQARVDAGFADAWAWLRRYEQRE